jgi:asparagine synthase (glutamine-hydrolysing)
MCGITGFVNINRNTQPIGEVIGNMTNSLRHRGPDDEGFVFFNESLCESAGGKDTPIQSWNNRFNYSPKKRIEEISENYHFAFGHRRLSVIDLSEGGHQPMCSDDNKIWITCNGEIYNYLELKEELRSDGFEFSSKSDIEVLLKAYKKWGIHCLEKLNGMWSFVIYDQEKQILFGSRDRLGVKPMYYSINQNYFAFASEQKALLQIPNNDFGINYSNVFNHLLKGKVETDSIGLYHKIEELLPSNYFIFDLKQNNLKIERYYTLNF